MTNGPTKLVIAMLLSSPAIALSQTLAWSPVTPPALPGTFGYNVYLRELAVQPDYSKYESDATPSYDLSGIVSVGADYEAYVRSACNDCDPPLESYDSNHIQFTVGPPPTVIQIPAPPVSITLDITP